MKTLSLLLTSSMAISVMAQTLPSQPNSGPGGDNYPHGDPSITFYPQPGTVPPVSATLQNSYWLVEPANPAPAKAPVLIYLHGNYNVDIALRDAIYRTDSLFVDHLARKGYIVIYPLFEVDGDGLGVNARVANACNVVNLALTELMSQGHVPISTWAATGEPKIGGIGGSLGAGAILRLAGSTSCSLPTINAIASFNPGTVAMNRLAAIGDTVPILIISSQEDAVNGPATTRNSHRETWRNIVMNRTSLDTMNYITAMSDRYGNTPMVADHNFAVSGTNPMNQFVLNALDFYGSWKWATALFNCTFKGRHCNFCLGARPNLTFMGNFGDGRPANRAVVGPPVIHSPITPPTSR